MTRWVLEPEYISCIVLVILIIYAYLQRFSISLKQTAFRCSLIISLAAIVVNIGSVHCIERPLRLPMWFNSCASGWSFTLTALMILSIVFAALTLIYEDRYDSRGFRIATGLCCALFTAMLILVLVNDRRGLLFRFTEDGAYVRGPLNAACYVCLIAGILICLVCYCVERSHVHRAFRRVLFTLPPVAVLFGLVQLISPHTILTGSAAAIALMVLFINGQLQRLNADQLTDLGTRESFYRLLEQYVQKGIPFRVIIVSIRNYKDVNTRFGQRGGDAFLREIGNYLYGLRGVAAFRFTGVEFAILSRWSGGAEYEELLDTLRARFQTLWTAEGRQALLSACFADIAFPEVVSDVNDMIRSLEYASRLAKDRGEGTVLRFDKQLKSAFGRRNYVIGLLKRAMEEDRFFLHFQPIYERESGRLCSAEALLRLNEDNGTPIPPGEFIPLAEETGQVEEIGWIVLERVLCFLSTHRDLPLKWISVNISAQQYQAPRFAERIRALLERYAVAPSLLKLEITERVIIEDIERARQTMRALKEIGVGAGLDDFGTGYSNLANALSLPFEMVKIDKSYVDHIVEDQYAFVLLETLIGCIRALDMLVLAEGVETAEQFKMMEWLNTDHVQGYYFSRPLPEEDFIRFLQQDR
ncbi:MAG: EAL domain-containing protein [Clostridia bacterium]|nr:EAL domain-containing protein [Clostridia bacterium]